MPSDVCKPKRNKASTAKSTSSKATTTASNSSGDHPYLRPQERTAIESWKATVPQKSTLPKDVPMEHNSVIQAYLEVKLSLFRNAGVTNVKDYNNMDACSISSTQS